MYTYCTNGGGGRRAESEEGRGGIEQRGVGLRHNRQAGVPRPNESAAPADSNFDLAINGGARSIFDGVLRELRLVSTHSTKNLLRPAKGFFFFCESRILAALHRSPAETVFLTNRFSHFFFPAAPRCESGLCLLPGRQHPVPYHIPSSLLLVSPAPAHPSRWVGLWADSISPCILPPFYVRAHYLSRRV